jgi:hypothetical protein
VAGPEAGTLSPGTVVHRGWQLMLLLERYNRALLRWQIKPKQEFMASCKGNGMGRSFDRDLEDPALLKPGGAPLVPAPCNAAAGRRVREVPLARNGCS